MPKLTTFEKNENKGQDQNDFSNRKSIKCSLEPISISIAEPDLLDLGLFNSEKTNCNDNATCSQIDDITAQTKFDELLSEAVDETLSSLGETVKNTIYFQLENSFNIPKKEIPNQIDEFSNIIQKIFGFGASRLEINLMKNLHSKINTNIKVTEYEWPLSKWVMADMSFCEYVNATRKSFLEKRQGTE
ncbi:MAG TPA: hypothetical protein VLU95_04820 [Candidatus Acidoferrum sp.]|nr:hypothetical protein [Candidatus Acidoferrum sp.]